MDSTPALQTEGDEIHVSGDPCRKHKRLHPDSRLVNFEQIADELTEINAAIRHKVECKLATIPIKASAYQDAERRKTAHANPLTIGTRRLQSPWAISFDESSPDKPPSPWPHLDSSKQA